MTEISVNTALQLKSIILKKIDNLSDKIRSSSSLNFQLVNELDNSLENQLELARKDSPNVGEMILAYNSMTQDYLNLCRVISDSNDSMMIEVSGKHMSIRDALSYVKFRRSSYGDLRLLETISSKPYKNKSYSNGMVIYTDSVIPYEALEGSRDEIASHLNSISIKIDTLNSSTLIMIPFESDKYLEL